MKTLFVVQLLLCVTSTLAIEAAKTTAKEGEKRAPLKLGEFCGKKFAKDTKGDAKGAKGRPGAAKAKVGRKCKDESKPTCTDGTTPVCTDKSAPTMTEGKPPYCADKSKPACADKSIMKCKDGTSPYDDKAGMTKSKPKCKDLSTPSCYANTGTGKDPLCKDKSAPVKKEGFGVYCADKSKPACENTKPPTCKDGAAPSRCADFSVFQCHANTGVSKEPVCTDKTAPKTYIGYPGKWCADKSQPTCENTKAPTCKDGTTPPKPTKMVAAKKKLTKFMDIKKNGGCAVDLCCGIAKKAGMAESTVQLCNTKTAKTYTFIDGSAAGKTDWAFMCGEGASKLAAACTAAVAAAYMM